MAVRSVWRVLIVLGLAAGGWAGEAKVDFDRQVRPILANHCFACHGPDEDARESGLRLDVRAGAIGLAESGKPAIVPGKPAESSLVRRIVSANPKFVMPPPTVPKPLSDAQKAILRTWVEQGADYQTHWSFQAPVRPQLPAVGNGAWPRNAIDRFILARLEAEGLRPVPEADRPTLIRRATLDLTGLPPTPAEVDAFLNDSRPDAFEKVVDRLLASPRCGERLAVDWLDAARYADTHGYHIDSGRDMTRWRDWVIAAFNRNLPFDQFTIEQIAGDLLPNATRSQKVASGFNRNHMITFEGGAIPEEYLTNYIIDRVNTTGTVWLGLSVGCAQCHDHKFDPIAQKEYYRLFAFFNNVPESGLDGSKGNAAPLIPAPSDAQQEALDRLAGAIAAAERQLDGPWPEVDAAQSDWERRVAEYVPAAWTDLDLIDVRAAGGASFVVSADKALWVEGANPATDAYTVTVRLDGAGMTALRLEALPDKELVANGPGRSANGNVVLTDVRVALDGVPIPLKAASADFSQTNYPVAYAIDDRAETGWAIYPEVGKPHSAVFELDRPFREGRATLTVTLAFESSSAQHQLGKFRLARTDSDHPHGTDRLPGAIAQALAVAPDARTAAQQVELRTYYRAALAPAAATLRERLAQLRAERAGLEKRIPTAMVMAELPQPRDTFLLVRGQYDQHGEKLAAGVPAFLPELPAGAPANRLALARWLVDPGNPLVGRVTVNRFWQSVFGTGLVKTAEDFGTQGDAPSHPELLDWLAVEFLTAEPGRKAGWDVKALLRLLVTSATYRQASTVTPDGLTRDPENRLLGRGPRVRLQAEFVRDQALAIGGLLDGRIGGPSVSPYQPPGLWEELASRADGKNWTAQVYTPSHGGDLYRRAMYTFWKRTSPPPNLAAFDAPDRETCTVRRSRTNTPLQALVLLNDPIFVEAARKFAERTMTEGGKSTADRIAFAFRLATARPPTAEEQSILQKLYDHQLAVFRTAPTAALQLLRVGESPRNEALDPAELAAWSVVASTLLNLDETVTKG